MIQTKGSQVAVVVVVAVVAGDAAADAAVASWCKSVLDNDHAKANEKSRRSGKQSHLRCTLEGESQKRAGLESVATLHYFHP